MGARSGGTLGSKWALARPAQPKMGKDMIEKLGQKNKCCVQFLILAHTSPPNFQPEAPPSVEATCNGRESGRRRFGGEARKSGEKAVARHRAGRERWQGTERWEGVGFYKACGRRPPKLAHAWPLFPTRTILSRRLCYLYSLLYCYIHFIFSI